jgi:hypothetical protein
MGDRIIPVPFLLIEGIKLFWGNRKNYVKTFTRIFVTAIDTPANDIL